MGLFLFCLEMLVVITISYPSERPGIAPLFLGPPHFSCGTTFLPVVQESQCLSTPYCPIPLPIFVAYYQIPSTFFCDITEN